MKTRSTVSRWVLVGLKIDVLIIVLLFLYVFISSLYTYNGKCPDIFTANYEDCSRSDYIELNFIFFLIVVFVGQSFFLLLFLVPLGLYMLVGAYKTSRKKSDNRSE